MSRLRRAVKDVRAATALAPARPAYAAGIRAALATVVPLLVGSVLGIGGGTWMSLAGFSGAIADRGGPYQTRAGTIGALAVAGALAAALGTLASSRLALAIPLMCVVAVACSLARVWGNAGASVGGSVLTIFVIALAFPSADPVEALRRGGFTLIGALWAMVLALVLWPLRPYRPVRAAVAGCYRALADYAAAIASGVVAGTDADASGLPAGSVAVRVALEEARAALATMRRGRPGESGRGERLVVLREVVDQLFGHLVALAETLDAIPLEERARGVHAAVAGALAELAAALRTIAGGVEAERRPPAMPVPSSDDAIRAALAAGAPALASAGVAEQYAHAAVLLDRVAQYVGVGATTTAALNDGHGIPALDGLRDVEEIDTPLAPMGRLRAILAPDSVVLRYALRVGLVTAAAGVLPPLVRTRVERLTRQLKTLHDAVERWVSARAREPSGTGARDAQRPAVGLAPRKGAAPY